MTSTVDLHDGWTLTATAPAPDAPTGIAGSQVPATVPGCVHTDLMAAGLLADPYLDRNEELQHWVGRTAWTYRTTFDAPAEPAARHDLVFEGLDTVATVERNGAELGRTAN